MKDQFKTGFVGKAFDIIYPIYLLAIAAVYVYRSITVPGDELYMLVSFWVIIAMLFYMAGNVYIKKLVAYRQLVNDQNELIELLLEEKRNRITKN